MHDWLPGWIASVPAALLLLSTRGADDDFAALVATAVILLSVPWIIPATMLLAVLSSPLYMWLHTQGAAPAVLEWLGSVVLVAAVVGCHVNAALLVAWRRANRTQEVETGLRDFLLRSNERE
ncbi:MAG: hypothetical protein ACRECQ_18710 [Burkholderiaceae bacterium]